MLHKTLKINYRMMTYLILVNFDVFNEEVMGVGKQEKSKKKQQHNQNQLRNCSF